ncbi:unnamed protein product [Brassica oleracea]|uniref:Uncharacterized protein n=1 Tax=Brassica oleracea TaxID=3712 RepID=A0A3P6DLJ5_BRAOL|nr:unnamed protein product [Brassica oleracea]
MVSASYLVDIYRRALCLANKDVIFLLYLTFENIHLSLVKAMLKTARNHETELYLQLERRKYLAHTAFKSMTIDLRDTRSKCKTKSFG